MKEWGEIMNKKLGHFLSITNLTLLYDFKNGIEGENNFYQFMRLVRDMYDSLLMQDVIIEEYKMQIKELEKARKEDMQSLKQYYEEVISQSN